MKLQEKDTDKKSLRKVVHKALAHKELQKAVLALRKPTDPEMDQGVSITVHALLISAEGVVTEEWRPNRMEGSDCDDGDQHSGDCASGKRIDSKLRSIPAVPLI